MLRSIEEKKAWFDFQCNLKRISYTEDSITLVIDRENLLRDSFEQFRTTDRFDLHKEIKIFYVGEVALDAGGLMRQWVTDLTKILFSTSFNGEQEGINNHGLFIQTRSEGDITYFPNPYFNNQILQSGVTSEEFYRFAGSVLAKSIFEKVPVSVKLHPVLLKLLLGTPNQINLEDLRIYDE
jgi:hypothetical protein